MPLVPLIAHGLGHGASAVAEVVAPGDPVRTTRPQVELVDARTYRLRHVAPAAAGTTVLGRVFAATELPVGHLVTSPDLVTGRHTRRLGDAGDVELSFPNAEGSDGIRWAERFSADLALEWIEVLRDDHLEQVAAVSAMKVSRGDVVITGQDGWALLRRQSEPDRSWAASPADVVRHYTQVWRPAYVDQFPGTSLSGDWSVAGSGASATVAGGRLRMTTTLTGCQVFQGVNEFGPLGTDWRVVVAMPRFTAGAAAPPTDSTFVLVLRDGATEIARVVISKTSPSDPGGISLDVDELGVAARGEARLSSADISGPHTIEIIQQGGWIRASVSGHLAGFVRAPATSVSIDNLYLDLSCLSGAAPVVEVDYVYIEQLTPFLGRGSDRGDCVLPGDYPHGGLRSQHFNDADLAGLALNQRARRVLAPGREPYGERQDRAPGAETLPLQPGAASGSAISVRWTGAIYLDLTIGNWDIRAPTLIGGGRMWVGRTGWGEQVIDDWPGSASIHSAAGVITAATLGSKLGWYTLVIEYNTASALFFTATIEVRPPGSGTLTLPDGTTLTRGVYTAIPAGMLSPLGCYLGRVQGSSHFDMVQQTAAAYGYELLLEPMSLESGEFPGRLVPRVRAGRDTGVVIRQDDLDRDEPLIDPQVSSDGSEQVISLRGLGTGLPDGRGSNVTAEVIDLDRVAGALFRLDATENLGEIASAQLLDARLSVELALRGELWQEVTGTPRAQDQLADTWPLTGALSAMRFVPGDAVFLYLPDLGVRDPAPRRILQTTRTFGPEGRQSSAIGFRQRPRSQAFELRRLLTRALRPTRAYQHQVVSIPAGRVENNVAAGGFTGYSIAMASSRDPLVRAFVRVSINTGNQSWGLEVNDVDQTSALGGPWQAVPAEIDVTHLAVARSLTDARAYARLKNLGAAGSDLDAQLILEVLR